MFSMDRATVLAPRGSPRRPFGLGSWDTHAEPNALSSSGRPHSAPGRPAGFQERGPPGPGSRGKSAAPFPAAVL